MPYRNIVFATGEVYHIVNRGVAQAPIFQNKRDYFRMLEVIWFYRHFKPPLRFSFYNQLPKRERENLIKSLNNSKENLVEVLAFCLMPNHLHFLLKQLKDGGISVFMRKLQDSYARFFNIKYKRNGSLFQAMFKAIRVENDEQLLHVSRYIHLNPATSYLIDIKNLEDYFWSSFPDYIGKRSLEGLNPSFILNFFKTKKQYRQFIFDQADYQRELSKVRHLILEE